VEKENKIVVAKYFMGMPFWEPARGINKALEEYYKKIGFEVITKPLKKIKDSAEIKGFRNKCNFDVEMHDEILKDLDNLEMVYLATGDSDFLRTKEVALGRKKRIKFLTFKTNCAWEIRQSWHIFLDDIKDEIIRTKL